jgi:hypothetical protein
MDMATLTINPLGLVFWALLVTFAVCGGVFVLMAFVVRRNQENLHADVDRLHVHCFPLDKRVQRKCLICGVAA